MEGGSGVSQVLGTLRTAKGPSLLVDTGSWWSKGAVESLFGGRRSEPEWLGLEVDASSLGRAVSPSSSAHGLVHRLLIPNSIPGLTWVISHLGNSRSFL